MSDSENLERRGFIKVILASLGAIMGGIIGIPAIGYLVSPASKVTSKEAWIPLGPLENYPLGRPTLFTFTRSVVNGWEKSSSSYGAFVVRSSPEDVRVYSNICTHLCCRVNWDENQTQYVCPCHDAHFTIDGKVASGPPPRPLDQYEVKVENGNLSIHFVEA